MTVEISFQVLGAGAGDNCSLSDANKVFLGEERERLYEGRYLKLLGMEEWRGEPGTLGR